MTFYTKKFLISLIASTGYKSSLTDLNRFHSGHHQPNLNGYISQARLGRNGVRSVTKRRIMWIKKRTAKTLVMTDRHQLKSSRPFHQSLCCLSHKSVALLRIILDASEKSIAET